MPVYPSKAITLIELLIAITLLAVIILGVNSINVFSSFQLLSTNKRAKLQNDASLCLEHMGKYLAKAIGNETLNGGDTAVYINTASGNTTILSVFADMNGNGIRDSDGSDYWIGYTFNPNNHILSYCNRCSSASCAACSVTREDLAKDVTVFSASKNFSVGSNINLSLAACWDPTGTKGACGTSDNPSVTMSSSINLPSVSGS